MFTLGPQEIIVIFVLALVLFGPKKLPELGRTIGKALTEFRRHSNDLKATFEREMSNLERESEHLNRITQDTASQVFDHATRALPSADAWNPLNYEADASPTPATQHSQASSDAATTVGASAIPGAESHGTTETAVATEPEFASAIEGTVARKEMPAGSEIPQHS